MDKERFEALQQKAQTSGLSDDEAKELGQLYAEAEGEKYSNAETRGRTAGDDRRDEEAIEAADQEAVRESMRDRARLNNPRMSHDYDHPER